METKPDQHSSADIGEVPSPETVAALPALLNEAFLAGEIGIWNILPWAAAEIERLRSEPQEAPEHGGPK